MKKFQYLIDKVNDSQFIENPFKYVYIENFFNEEHFQEIIKANEINVPRFKSTKEMIYSLIENFHYQPQPFPGCITNIENYLYWITNKKFAKKIKEADLLEGIGMALRLHEYQTSILKDLVDFFNSKNWHDCLKKKFNKTNHTTVETAIQKYLTGYEISPHPDIRKKCLTYMININPSDEAENLDLHTHFLKLNDNKKWIYKYWADNLSVERCWVPWEWATTIFKQEKNNSISIFAPDNDTVHAVKLNYDHCIFQRTQFYGNLWYKKSELSPSNWKLLQELEKN